MSLEEQKTEFISPKEKLFKLFGVTTEEELKEKLASEEIGHLIPSSRDFNEFVSNINEKEINKIKESDKKPILSKEELFELLDELSEYFDEDQFLGYEDYQGEMCVKIREAFDGEIFYMNHARFSERVSNILKNSHDPTFKNGAQQHQAKRYLIEKEILDNWPKKTA